MMDHSHGGRQGNWLTVNGVGMDEASLEVKQFERLRLRLINVANTQIFTLSLEGLSAWLHWMGSYWNEYSLWWEVSP